MIYGYSGDVVDTEIKVRAGVLTRARGASVFSDKNDECSDLNTDRRITMVTQSNHDDGVCMCLCTWFGLVEESQQSALMVSSSSRAGPGQC